MDGQRRAARPGAERERAGRQARVGRRDRLADPAHAHADGGGAAAVRDQAQALGPGGDRHPLRGADPQRPNPSAPGAHVRGKLRRFPVVCPFSRCDVFPRRGTVAAFRRFAAVPGGDQRPDEAHSAGQGEQRRQPAAGARARYGLPYPGGGRGGADRPGRADRRGQNARARHHQGTAAFCLRVAPADRRGPDEGPVRAPGGGGRRALPRYRNRRGQLHRGSVLAVVRGAAGRADPAEFLCAAAAALHDRGRDADGDGGNRRPGGRDRRLGRPVHRRDPGPGPVRRALRPAAGGRAQPPHRDRHHRRAGRRQDHAGHAADLPAGDARRHGGGDRPQGRRGVAGGVPEAAGPQGPGAAAQLGRAGAARPVLVRRWTCPRSGRWPPRRCGCCCRG